MKNKRFALALTAILCAIAICAAMIPALSVFADAEPERIPGIVVVDVTDPYYEDGVFHADYLFDFDEGEGSGWQATEGAEPTEADPIYITADLKGVCEIYYIAIYAVLSYDAEISAVPAAFELQLSNDDRATWTPVATVTDQVCTVDDGMLFFDVSEEGAAPKQATDFRIVIQAPGANDAGLTGMSEIEVYGFVIEEETETETETQTETETETETTAPTQNETVAESEGAVESEDADESENVEESETVIETVEETVGETEVGETVAETTAGTTAPAADDGCASVVGFGAVAILTAAAAAVVLKKKD